MTRRLSIVTTAGAFLLLGSLLFFAPFQLNGHSQKAAHALVSGAALLLVLSWVRLPQLMRRVMLLVLVVASILNVLRFDTRRLSHIDHHDVVCYYLGGKYAAEVGSFGLYPALVEADRVGRRWTDFKANYWQQSRDGFERKSLRFARKEGRAIRKESFSKERWKEFESDVRSIQKTIGQRRFRSILRDKGFNATPAWITYASPIMNAISVEDVWIIAKADLLLLSIAFGFVGFTFGFDTLLFGLLFLCSSISSKWLIPGSVLFRYDWVALLVIGLCLVQRGWLKSAGVVTAISGALRLFPVVWIYGSVARFVTTFIGAPAGKRLKASLPLGAMLLAFGIAFAAIEAFSINHVGVEAATDQWKKMQHHTSPEMISSKRPGLALALAYDGEFKRERLSSSRRRLIQDQVPLRYGLAALLLIILGWVLRRHRHSEAYALGYLPFFLLATGTYYYHIARLTLVVMHAADLQKLRNRVGLAFLFLLEVHSNLIFYYVEEKEVFWTGWLSWALMTYILGLTLWLYLETRSVKDAPNSSFIEATTMN